MFVSEIYALEDCFYWNATGLTYTSNSSTDRKVLTGLEDTLEFTPNGNFEFSYTEADTSNGKRLYLISKPQSTSTSNNYGIGGDIDASSVAVTLRTTSSSRKANNGRVSPSSFKFIIDGTDVSGYIDGTLKNTWTNVNWWSTYAPYTLSYAIWGTGTGTWTNIKIKPL